MLLTATKKKNNNKTIKIGLNVPNYTVQIKLFI